MSGMQFQSSTPHAQPSRNQTDKSITPSHNTTSSMQPQQSNAALPPPYILLTPQQIFAIPILNVTPPPPPEHSDQPNRQRIHDLTMSTANSTDDADMLIFFERAGIFGDQDHTWADATKLLQWSFQELAKRLNHFLNQKVAELPRGSEPPQLLRDMFGTSGDMKTLVMWSRNRSQRQGLVDFRAFEDDLERWKLLKTDRELSLVDLVELVSEAKYRADVPGQGWVGVAGQGVSGQGVSEQSVLGQSVPGQGVNGQGVPGQSVPGQGIPRQDVPRQEAPRQRVPKQGIKKPDTKKQSRPAPLVRQVLAPKKGAQNRANIPRAHRANEEIARRTAAFAQLRPGASSLRPRRTLTDEEAAQEVRIVPSLLEPTAGYDLSAAILEQDSPSSSTLGIGTATRKTTTPAPRTQKRAALSTIDLSNHDDLYVGPDHPIGQTGPGTKRMGFVESAVLGPKRKRVTDDAIIRPKRLKIFSDAQSQKSIASEPLMFGEFCPFSVPANLISTNNHGEYGAFQI